MVSENQSIELRDTINSVEKDCDMEYQGSRVFKDIMIMVMFAFGFTNGNLYNKFQRLAADHLDRDGSALVRFQREGPASLGSPFIMAVQVSKYCHCFC